MFSIFFLIGFSIVVAMALAIFVTRRPVPGQLSRVPPEDDAALDPKDKPVLSYEDLARLGESLCKKNSLTVRDRIQNSPREMFWIADSANEFFFGTYVFCFILISETEPFVSMTEVLEFKDFVKSVQSTKGFVFTNGYFTRDVHQPLEGPKVALYNRRRVIEELEKL